MALAQQKRPTEINPGIDRDLCQQALGVASNAYAPFSGFAVGCAVRSETGEVFVGANLETSNFDPIHAEAAALAAWNAAGAPKLKAIAIVGYQIVPEKNIADVVTPCGKCRQLIFEAGQRTDSSFTLFCCNGDLSEIESYNIEDLLPHAFDLHRSSSVKKWNIEKAKTSKRAMR